MRVLINGRFLAAGNGADIEVVEHFALVHDMMRENENLDLYHGPRAADFIKTIAGRYSDVMYKYRIISSISP